MYSFVQTPDRFPHQCFTCGGGTNREWYLDLGEMNESPDVMMPTVYICNLCIVAICAERGLVNEAPSLAKIEELETSLYHAKVKAEGLEAGLNGLLAARFLNPNDPSVLELVDFVSHHQSDASGSHGDDRADVYGSSEEGIRLDLGEGTTPESDSGGELGGFPTGLSINGSNT